MKWWWNAKWWNSDEMGLCVQGIVTEKKNMDHGLLNTQH